MKVLHIITGLGIGGAENVLLRLVGVLGAGSDDHEIVSLGSASDLRTSFEAASDFVEEVDWRPSPGLLREARRLRQIVKARQPDLVVGWMYHGNLAAELATAGSSVPTVWNIRQSLYDIADEKALTRVVIRLLARLSRRPVSIIYNSVTSEEHHGQFGFCRANARVIPNGFDTHVFRPDEANRRRLRREFGIAEPEIVIACVARYHPVKGHDILLEAAAAAIGANERAKLLLVGSGVTRQNSHLAGRVRELGLQDKVLLCGARDDIPAVYAAADLAVLASLAESFPNSVAEAMATGLPCIATDVGDVREIIGDTGLVVPPGDHRRLADALHRAISMSAETRRKLGLQARDRISERYTMAVMVEAFTDCFNKQER